MVDSVAQRKDSSQTDGQSVAYCSVWPTIDNWIIFHKRECVFVMKAISLSVIPLDRNGLVIDDMMVAFIVCVGGWVGGCVYVECRSLWPTFELLSHFSVSIRPEIIWSPDSIRKLRKRWPCASIHWNIVIDTAQWFFQSSSCSCPITICFFFRSPLGSSSDGGRAREKREGDGNDPQAARRAPSLTNVFRPFRTHQ